MQKLFFILFFTFLSILLKPNVLPFFFLFFYLLFKYKKIILLFSLLFFTKETFIVHFEVIIFQMLLDQRVILVFLVCCIFSILKKIYLCLNINWKKNVLIEVLYYIIQKEKKNILSDFKHDHDMPWPTSLLLLFLFIYFY